MFESIENGLRGERRRDGLGARTPEVRPAAVVDRASTHSASASREGAGKLLALLSAARGLSRIHLAGIQGSDRARAVGALTAQCLSDLGPLYTKLGQVISTRADLFPPDFVEQLAWLRDDCAPSSTQYVLGRVRAALGGPVSSLFESFDETPLACASIAQVHRGVTRDGRVLALKVVKQHVAKQLEGDLLLLERLLRVLERVVPALREFRAHAHFAEIARLLKAQASMQREAANQAELHARLLGHPFIRIPQVLAEHSSDDVLVMEFVDGIRGKDFARVRVPARTLARRFQHAIYSMVYSHGVFHADPHPGNVIFSEDGTISFVDFGVVGRLTEDEKWALSSFYFACSRKDWPRACERFLRHFVDGVQLSEPRRDEFFASFVGVLRRHLEHERSRWSTIAFVKDGQAVLRQFGARYTARFSHVALAFLTGEGFLSQIDPDIDIWENARLFTDRASPYMSDAVRARFDQEFATTQPGSKLLKERAQHVLVAPTHLDRYYFPSQYPLFVRRARGCTFIDEDGNEYIDLSSGYGPHLLGYGHPAIQEGITAGLEAGAVNAIGCQAEVELAEAITSALPGSERAVLSNSGTEAVLQAIRLCRAARGRERVAKFEGHYHGFSDHGLVSSWFRFSGPAQTPTAIAMPGVHRKAVDDTLVLPYGQDAALEAIEQQADTLACVICEPLQSALASSDPEFLAKLRKLCSRVGVPLIFDEVVSGFRVAYGGMQNRLGIVPDLTVLGKVIGGGLPCGAVAGRAELIELCKSSGDPFIDFEQKAFLGGTMSGNSLTCAAGVAMLRYLAGHPEVYQHLERLTAKLTLGLRDAATAQGVHCFVRGYASIFSLTFAHRDSRSVREQHAASNYKANIALAYYMRRFGVYMPELHTMLLNAAHDDRAIERVVQAFAGSLAQMTKDGFFTN